MTTSLIWFVRELLKPINDYRAANQIYDDYQKAKPLFAFSSAEQSAPSTVTTTAALSASENSANVEHEESEGWLSYLASLAISPLTYLAPSSSSTAEAVPPSTEPSLPLSSRAYVAVASNTPYFHVKAPLKAAKVVEATEFVAAIDKILYQPLSSDLNKIADRLKELETTVSLEIDRMKRVLKEHDQTSGDYDALLCVFDAVLLTAARADVLSALNVALRFEADVTTISTSGKSSKKKASSSAPATSPILTNMPIPEIRDLTSFLMQQVMYLYIDESRSKEPRLKHARALPETQANNLIQKNLDAIKTLDSINSNYRVDTDAFDHMLPVLASLKLVNKETHEYLGCKNEYMLKSYEEISCKLNNSETIRAERIKGQMSFAPAPGMS